MRTFDLDAPGALAIRELSVLGDWSIYDPETQDNYGLEAVPERPYGLLVVGYDPVETVGERTRRAVEESLHTAYRVPADWSLALFKEREEGGEIRDGEGTLDTDFEMKVLDPSGEPYADLLVYKLEVVDGLVASAWFVVG